MTFLYGAGSDDEEEDVVGLQEPSGLQLGGIALRKRSKVSKKTIEVVSSKQVSISCYIHLNLGLLKISWMQRSMYK